MTEDKDFSDEELVAFLDNECDAGTRQHIELALKSSSVIRSRIENLFVEKTELKATFDYLLDSAPRVPISEELLKSTEASGTNPLSSFLAGWKQVAAVGIVALLIGGVLGNVYTNRQQDNWQSYVATYQALYANLTLEHINQSNADATAELERVFSTIGKKVEITDLKSFNQMDYKRSQILVFEGRPLVQMTFLSTTGQPVALCIMQSENYATSNVEYSVMEGMQSSRWTGNGYDYFLIGSNDANLIEAATKYFSSLL